MLILRGQSNWYTGIFLKVLRVPGSSLFSIPSDFLKSVTRTVVPWLWNSVWFISNSTRSTPSSLFVRVCVCDNVTMSILNSTLANWNWHFQQFETVNHGKVPCFFPCSAWNPFPYILLYPLKIWWILWLSFHLTHMLPGIAYTQCTTQMHKFAALQVENSSTTSKIVNQKPHTIY